MLCGFNPLRIYFIPGIKCSLCIVLYVMFYDFYVLKLLCMCVYLYMYVHVCMYLYVGVYVCGVQISNEEKETDFGAFLAALDSKHQLEDEFRER